MSPRTELTHLRRAVITLALAVLALTASVLSGQYRLERQSQRRAEDLAASCILGPAYQRGPVGARQRTPTEVP